MQGLQLPLVQHAMEIGERYRIKKYLRRAGPNFESFSGLDYVTRCPFYMVEFNRREPISWTKHISYTRAKIAANRLTARRKLTRRKPTARKEIDSEKEN